MHLSLTTLSLLLTAHQALALGDWQLGVCDPSTKICYIGQYQHGNRIECERKYHCKKLLATCFWIVGNTYAKCDKVDPQKIDPPQKAPPPHLAPASPTWKLGFCDPDTSLCYLGQILHGEQIKCDHKYACPQWGELCFWIVGNTQAKCQKVDLKKLPPIGG